MTRRVSLQEAIDRLDRRIAILDAGSSAWFREHLPAWRRRAAELVRIQGRLVRPESADPQQWEALLDHLASRVTAIMVDPDPDAGVDITLTATGGAAASAQNRSLTWPDVVQWVVAGAAGEPLGKIWTETDAGKTPEEVAQHVWFALRAGAMTGQSLRAWLETSVTADLAALLDALIVLWIADLYPQIARDWREHIRHIAILS